MNDKNMQFIYFVMFILSLVFMVASQDIKATVILSVICVCSIIMCVHYKQNQEK